MSDWRTISKYPEYEINIRGVVRRRTRSKGTHEKRILKARLSNVGYLTYHIRSNRKSMTCTQHKLLALAFIENPENKPCINHKNGVKTDNRIENLEWCTFSENAKHAIKEGLSAPAKGNKHPRSKLTAEDVREIRSIGTKKTREELSKIFGVSIKTIGLILRRKSWVHI